MLFVSGVHSKPKLSPPEDVVQRVYVRESCKDIGTCRVSHTRCVFWFPVE